MSASAIQFERVDYHYKRRKPVLEGFDLAVAPGQVLLLAAPNGAGKSTGIHLGAGVLKPVGGHVEVLGSDPHRERGDLNRGQGRIGGLVLAGKG